MDILVVEDNLLVGEMIRLAVEDAWFNVVGPAPTLEAGLRLAESTELDGAVLDINLGGHQVFPLARHLRRQDVPFIFVSGYDRTVLPVDMRATPFITKPVSVEELTRVAADKFAEGKTAAPGAVAVEKRATALRQRLATGERRVATQRRRLERLQFEGHDRYAVQLATDLLTQMQISVDLIKQTLAVLDASGAVAAAGGAITRLISDDIIDADDPESIARWAQELGTTPQHLVQLLAIHGPSARVIVRALGLEKYDGPSRKSTA